MGDFEVTIEPGSMDYDLLRDRVERGEAITVRCTAPWSEPVFEKGDRVIVPFDAGPGPAVVLGSTDEYVRVSYGRDGKYSTSLPPGSVSTKNRRQHPARIEVCHG
jgi:hypothetical protein